MCPANANHPAQSRAGFSFALRIAAVIALAAILPLVISSAARAADVIEVSALNGYLSDIRGLRIDQRHVGRRLQIRNVPEVASLELTLVAVTAIPANGLNFLALHLEQPDGAERGKANICTRRVDGSNWLIPISGRWMPNGALNGDAPGATLACASGAIGKCMEWGFAPWSAPDYFTACTRMVRADYCGDGRSHTKPGIQIAFDKFDRPWQVPPRYRFEAIWGADGAHCITAPRVATLFSPHDLQKQCPGRVRIESSAAACRELAGSAGTKPLLANFVRTF